MNRPSAEQLRSLDVRELRERFEIGMQEARRLKIQQRVKDNIEQLEDERVRRILLDLLFLTTGET